MLSCVVFLLQNCALLAGRRLSQTGANPCAAYTPGFRQQDAHIVGDCPVHHARSVKCSSSRSIVSSFSKASDTKLRLCDDAFSIACDAVNDQEVAPSRGSIDPCEAPYTDSIFFLPRTILLICLTVWKVTPSDILC